MRAEFAQAMIGVAQRHPSAVFITGDLGYMALESVRESFGGRFINAGVAEQNMVSVAAGMAHEGFVPWLYSIAPFAVLRPFEQIRNDVCLHKLPVKIVGNGGGYGYGIMGATHHTLEDVGVMRVLPHMRVYIPLCTDDVAPVVELMIQDPSPNYLRLNLAPRPPVPVAPFAPWRRLKKGKKLVVIGAGPVLWNVFSAADPAVLDAMDIWSIGIFPMEDLPPELCGSIASSRRVVTIEEHYGQCGLNESLAAMLLRAGLGNITYRSAFALGYPSGRYGSQLWHQQESGLAGQPLGSLLSATLHA